jgi:hypothetical protein
MSHSHLAASSSSNFHLIINNALKAYEKRTKKDLLAHPLAAQLQACDSLGAVLTVLQQQVQGLDQSRSDDRWTRWLDPTVNVLFSFSATLGAGVGLVSPTACGHPIFALSYLLGRYFHLLLQYLRVLASFFQYVASITRRGSLLHIYFSGSEGRSSKSRRYHGHLRTHRDVFPTSRGVHGSTAERRNDGYYHSNYG